MPVGPELTRLIAEAERDLAQLRNLFDQRNPDEVELNARLMHEIMVVADHLEALRRIQKAFQQE